MTTYIYSAIDRETGMTVKNSISSTELTVLGENDRKSEPIKGWEVKIGITENDGKESCEIWIPCVSTMSDALKRISAHYELDAVVEVQ